MMTCHFINIFKLRFAPSVLSCGGGEGGRSDEHKYLVIFKLSTEERGRGILANKTFTVAFRGEGKEKESRWVEYIYI